MYLLEQTNRLKQYTCVNVEEDDDTGWLRFFLLVGVWVIVLFLKRKVLGMNRLVFIVFIAACGSGTQPVNQPVTADDTCEMRLDGALEFGRECTLYRDSYQVSLKERAEKISNLEYQVEYLTRRYGEASILINVYESQLITDGCVTKEYKIGPVSTSNKRVLEGS